MPSVNARVTRSSSCAVRSCGSEPCAGSVLVAVAVRCRAQVSSVGTGGGEGAAGQGHHHHDEAAVTALQVTAHDGLCERAPMGTRLRSDIRLAVVVVSRCAAYMLASWKETDEIVISVYILQRHIDMQGLVTCLRILLERQACQKLSITASAYVRRGGAGDHSHANRYRRATVQRTVPVIPKV